MGNRALDSKGDVVIAKNYLQKDEIDSLNRLVDIFLTSAEERVKGRCDLTLDYWRKNVDSLLTFQDKDILQGRGTITNEDAEQMVNFAKTSFKLTLEVRSEDAFTHCVTNLLHRPEAATVQLLSRRTDNTIINGAVNVHQFLLTLTFEDILIDELRLKVSDAQLFTHFPA